MCFCLEIFCFVFVACCPRKVRKTIFEVNALQRKNKWPEKEVSQRLSIPGGGRAGVSNKIS